MNSAFINAIIQSKESSDRIYERVGGMEIEFFLQPATIFDVNDPENISRVRVLFGGDDDNAKSDWLPILNSGKGRVSSQYLDAKCIVASVSGNTDAQVVLGLFNDSSSNNLISSSPVTIPILDKADISKTEDPGSKCNKDNEGRVYIFSNNVSQDVKVCVRRNNRQTDPDADTWEWKNLTRGLVIEKSEDPKQLTDSSVAVNPKPLPKCQEKLEGEIIQFSEDRDFRQFPLICKKDENKNWAWVPVSSVPTYLKSMLPKCSEKIHGQLAVSDDGNNSELMICVRFDKKMNWVKYGTRTPGKWSKLEAVQPKKEIISSVKPNANLKSPSQLASAITQSPVLGNSKLAGAVFDQIGKAAAGIATTGSAFGALNAVAGFKTGLPGVDIAMQAGARILNESGSSVQALQAVLGSGDLGTAGNLIKSLGPAAESIIRNGGVNTSMILQMAGSDAFTTALGELSPSAVGTFNSLVVGGPQGALDAAIQYGSDFIPGPARDIFKSVTGELDLAAAPAALGNLLKAGGEGGLQDVVSGIANGVNFGGVNVGGLAQQLTSGNFGDIAKTFQDFSNFSSLTSLIPGLPASAGSLMGSIGLGGPMAMALPGGIGFQAATALLGGANPLSSILGGGGAFGAIGSALGGIFGGGNPCPCQPKCRKTEHGVDSDGNRLLDPAGNLTLNNSNVYGPDILNNNKGCLANEAGVKPTGIGMPLIPKNPLDFTAVIKSIPRVNELSSKLESAIKGGAEGMDMGLEMIYSLEAIEKTFKIADNNISTMELIERLGLIGSQSFMNNLITGPKGGLLGNVTKDLTTHSKAIEDLFIMVNKLNAVKDGGRINSSPTKAISRTIASIPKIPAYFSKSRIAALINLIKTILEAISVLGSLDPVFGTPFENLKTRNTESKVLKDSLAAKFDLNQPTEDTLNSEFSISEASGIRFLSQNQLDSGEFDTLLKQIADEQERARRGEGDCS